MIINDLFGVISFIKSFIKKLDNEHSPTNESKTIFTDFSNYFVGMSLYWVWKCNPITERTKSNFSDTYVLYRSCPNALSINLWTYYTDLAHGLWTRFSNYLTR